MNLDTFQHYMMTTFTRTKTSIELVSGPGLGKSSIVRQIAAQLSISLKEDVGLIVEMLANFDVPDIRGYQIPMKGADGTPIAVFTRPSFFPHPENRGMVIFRNGKELSEEEARQAPVPRYGIVFLDEFGQCDADVQKVAAELLLARRVGTFQLPEGWRVMAASNRIGDRAGVSRMLTHVENRRLRIEITPDVDVWVTWALKNGMHPLAIKWAEDNPGIVFAEKVPDKSGPFVTPRSLAACDAELRNYGEALGLNPSLLPGAIDDSLTPERAGASYNMANIKRDNRVATEIATGLLGEGAAAQFLASARLVMALPPLSEIIANPKKVPVPERTDVKLLAAGLISYHMNAKNVGPLLTYLERFGKEFQIMVIRRVNVRDLGLPESERVGNTAEFANWLVANSGLLIAINS